MSPLSVSNNFGFCHLLHLQTTSRRLADRKVERFENIKKRGAVPETATKKGSSYPVGPIVLGFFIFVVIGSCEFLSWLNCSIVSMWKFL